MSEEKTEEKKKERALGPRGEIGQATPSLYLRQQWREAHFHREDAGTKWNPNRKVWIPNKGAPSLKQFVRHLLITGDQVAKDWVFNKKGSKNQLRSDANIRAQREAAMASKAARKKVKQGGSKPSKETTPTK